MIAPEPGPRRWADFSPAVEEPAIVLQWLARLRWLAVTGQLIATLIAVGILKLKLPLTAINAIIALTFFSNLVIVFWKHQRVPPWLVPAVLLLDVFLLTALLLLTGGAANPFRVLYLVHVAMAVVALAEWWSWLVVMAAAAGYGLVLIWRPPFEHPLPLGPWAADAADWIALALVAGVIAYFVGRMTHSLRRQAAALADARELASRNQQLASLTTLAAGAAHELNTPLSTIAVVARELEVMSRRLEMGESFAADARLIRQEVDRCQFILARMRVDVLGEESPAATLVASKDFVAGLRDELRPVAGEALRIECSPGVGELSIPMAAVRQAVTILVDNAIDASPPGSPVTLCIEGRDDHIVFEVRDQGSGMSEEVARRAGEPFFTTKPPGQGMGLGLFLARLVAQKLGGSLQLQSRLGQGTLATLSLPRQGRST